MQWLRVSSSDPTVTSDSEKLLGDGRNPMTVLNGSQAKVTNLLIDS